MRYLRVAKWETFQHYKDRNPPWIKLHTSLLDDYDFACLQDASKALLVLIWLLASRTGNRFPADSAWIASKTGFGGKPDLNALIAAGFLTYDASATLADCEQDACLEAEGETETEGEKKRGKPRAPSPPSGMEILDRDEFAELRESERFVDVWADWIAHTKEPGSKASTPKGKRAEKLLGKCLSWGPGSAASALEHSMANNYQGVNPTWGGAEVNGAPVREVSPDEEAENIQIHQEIERLGNV